MRKQKNKLTDKTDTLPPRSPWISDEKSGIQREVFASACLDTTFCSIAPFDAAEQSEDVLRWLQSFKKLRMFRTFYMIWGSSCRWKFIDCSFTGSDSVAPWEIANNLGATTAAVFRVKDGRFLQNDGYHLREPHKTQKPIKCIRFIPAALRTV